MADRQPLSGLRVAVIGYGSIGRRHADNLVRLGIQRPILVRRPSGANAAFTPPPSAVVVGDLPAAVGLGIDAAVVCNPTSLHLATAAELVAAGVSVLIEKPLGDDPPALARLRSLLPSANLPIVGMAYCMRYHPAYRGAVDAYRRGDIGRPLYARAWFEAYLPDWHPWEDYRQSYAALPELGGGVLPTLDHELDFIHHLLGAPRLAAGRLSNTGALGIAAADLAWVQLLCPGDIPVGLTASFCRRDRWRGFELIGAEGTLSFDMHSGRLERRAAGTADVLWHDPDYDLNQMYLDTLRDFLEAAANRRPAPIPLQAGILAADICRALEVASAESRADQRSAIP